jgi:hypothetical protein
MGTLASAVIVNIDLEIDRPAIDFVIAEACGLGSAAAADLRWQFQWLLVLSPFFGFGKGAFGSRGQHLARRLRSLGCRDFAIVVVGFLHWFLLPENIENGR